MFGCSKCIQPGFSFPTSAHGTVHVYPYCPEDPHGPPRSHTQHDLDAAQALHQKTIINGVKGPSWLRKLMNYDIIDGTAIDYMHCVLLGHHEVVTITMDWFRASQRTILYWQKN